MSLVTLVVVAGFIIAALVGLFDREATRTAEASGQSVEVEYQSVARAGNEVELEIRVSSQNPLPKQLTVYLTEEYMKFFEDLAVFPDPESQTADGEGTVAFTLSAPKNARETVIRITGRASDQWDFHTPGIIQVQSGLEKIEIPVVTWRVP